MKKKAVITILGIQNPQKDDEGKLKVKNYNHQARYYFSDDSQNSKYYYNTLPLLIDKYANDYDIIPIYTEEAKIFNQDVLTYSKQNCKFDDNISMIDENDYLAIFNKIDEIINRYDEIIVDLTHGFRHLPILTIVDLIIQNFHSTEKVKNILFAKEIIKHTQNQKGEYEIVDLKEYLDIANISFILTTFEKNYTVANHIQSEKYNNLTKALNSFSNDIMALSLNNLFKKSSKKLIKELELVEDQAIKKFAQNLKEHIEKTFNYEGKKRYETYFDLAKDMFEKNYMLHAISLLYESIRLYIKSTIKKQHANIVIKIENAFENDLYAIGDFLIKLKDRKNTYKEKLKFKNNNINNPITENEFIKLKNSFPISLKEFIGKVASKRNNLAHANADNRTFKNIKEDIKKLFDEYYKKCIKEKNTNDLIQHFNNY